MDKIEINSQFKKKTGRSVLLVMVWAVLLCCFMSQKAYAASGTCGKNATWDYNRITNTLTISGNGVMEDYDYEGSIPWNEYKPEIKTIIISHGITNIGDKAFANCENATSVELSNSILHIGSSAFENCKRLKRIIVPEKVKTIGAYAFSDCESVTDVVFNAKSCSDFDYSQRFHNLGGSTQGVSVTFGNKVKRIPAYLFYTNNNYDAGNGVYAHVKTIKMSNAIKEIGEKSFRNCYDLVNVAWGSDIETIGSSAFDECVNLKSIIIPEKVKTIGAYAFSDCRSVTNVVFNAESCSDFDFSQRFHNLGGSTQGVNVTFGNKVKRIPAYLFYTNNNYDAGNGCYVHVKTIKMSNTIKEIGERSFRNCYDLANVAWGSDIETIGSSAFDECINLKSVFIPEKVKTIGAYAFSDCKSVTNVVFNAESCSDFDDCQRFYNLGESTQGVSVTFGNKVKRIPAYLFYTNNDYDAGNGCYAHIKAVYMSNTITTIGSNSFRNCYDLVSIILPSSLKSLGKYVFENCSKITIYALKGDYKYRIDKYLLDGTGTVAVNSPRNKNITNAKIPDIVTIAGVKFRITIISKNAFQNCGKLKTVTLGNNVSTLGENCFASCKILTSVTIGTNLNKINKNAFRGDSKLTKIIIKSKKLKTVCGSIFTGINGKAVIKVPSTKLKEYQKLLKGKGQGKGVKIVKL